jgi:cell division protein FtsB
MTITTKEAERFARWCDTEGFKASATALRSLAAERDALRAEVERLKAGGCARDQGTTQFCAEAVALKAENARLRAENAKLAASNHAYLSDYQEARGEIEKLRAALRSIAANTCCDRCQEAALVARAALGETQ